MADRDGVEIYNRVYPWPERFRLGDPVLVKEITGMTWPEFVAATQAMNDAVDDARESGDEPPEPDQVVLAGLIAVAFWQGNPQMSRDKVRRALERIPMEEIELVEGDDGEVDVGPPAVSEGAAGNSPSTTSSGSDDSPAELAVTETPPASTSDATNQSDSGSPGSPSPPPESPPA